MIKLVYEFATIEQLMEHVNSLGKGKHIRIKEESELPPVKEPPAIPQPLNAAQASPRKSKKVREIEKRLKSYATQDRRLDCQYCGKEFKPKSKRSRYCSNRCLQNDYYHTHKPGAKASQKLTNDPGQEMSRANSEDLDKKLHDLKEQYPVPQDTKRPDSIRFL